jgi:acylphosphatase
MSGDRHIIRHVIVRGRVQGVGFRMFVEHAALRRGVEGWVRNLRDGSVEAVLAGPVHTVQAVIETCRRGPAGAYVDAIEEREVGLDRVEERYPGELFSVLPTR